MPSAPAAVPSTFATLGNPLQTAPLPAATISVPAVPRPTVAVLSNATPVNSAPIDRVRPVTVEVPMSSNVREIRPRFEGPVHGISLAPGAHRKEDEAHDLPFGKGAGRRRLAAAGPAAGRRVVEIHRLSGDHCTMLKIRAASLEHFEGLLERLGKHGELRSSVVLSTQFEGRPVQPPSDDFLRATTSEGWS